ncbi:MAG: glycoside hydrolase family 43 protein [Paludibacter sp.]|jgi:alpha-N-arabinofuranosidase|nr:glycoside hydrolase family 43 protein [Paludibacter sp.]
MFLGVVGVSAARKTVKTPANYPVFSQFSYTGNDRLYVDHPLKADEFYSPILQGCYPDPSICKRGADYFMVVSSFSMFPGVPIFHSTDLVNWKQIGHVLDRKSQLKVTEAGVSEGIYAPVIRYNPHNETFYMITTQFASGIGNMVVKTNDPFKGWSDPVQLNFEGIDPSLFFDEDGKAYVVHNDAPEKALYDGHRVIKVWEYDVVADQVVAGSDRLIVDGGVDISQQPIWIEAPHIYKRYGRYYLMCAEGGTADLHSEVIFTSDSPMGPYLPAPSNPILTQRYLRETRPHKVEWAGHADLVEGPDGKLYGVFLAIRPNSHDRVNTGRETFILPVDWSGRYPVFQNGLIPLKPVIKLPAGVENKTGRGGFFPNGNFTYQEDFNSQQLDYRWIAMRGPREDFIGISDKGLLIKSFNQNIKAKLPISALFHRQQHTNFEAQVTMHYQPASPGDLAGLVCFQNETYNYVMGITLKDKHPYILLARTEMIANQVVTKVIASQKLAFPLASQKPASDRLNPQNVIKLRVAAHNDSYRFEYSLQGEAFKVLGDAVSGDILSTNVAGGFTGALIGLYATSANDLVP